MAHIRPKGCRKRHEAHMPSAGIIEDARQIIGLAAGQRDWNDTREAWLSRAARRLGMSYARVRKVWYRRVDDLWASEWLEMTAKAEEIRRQLQEIEAAHADLRMALERCDVRPVASASPGAQGAQGDGGREMVAERRDEGARAGAASVVPREVK